MISKYLSKITAFLLKALSNPKFQDKLLQFLKTDAVEYLIVSVLKISGIKAWLVKLLAERVIDETDEHIIEPVFNGIGYYGDKLEGAVIYRKVKDAQDVENWVAVLGDI